jgi:hypothetical protein
MMRRICETFCNSLTYKKVPIGISVTTPFFFSDGDPIVFFIVASGSTHYHIEDDGTQVPLLEASGVILTEGSRADHFRELLSEYDLSYDQDSKVIRTLDLPESHLPEAALRFTAALIRLQDLMLLHPVIVRNTFKEDAITAIQNEFGQIASVQEDAPISDHVPGFRADVVITAKKRPPVAIYLGTSNERALIALVVKMEIERYRGQQTRILLLVEKAKKNPVDEQAYALAHARLDGVLAFRGVERDAMNNIGKLLQ